MEEIQVATAFTTTAIPPPLPPKTRRSAAAGVTTSMPSSATAVVATSASGATGLTGAALSGGSLQPLSSISSSGEHVVKIRINPDDTAAAVATQTTQTGSIRISVGGSEPEDMVRRPLDSFAKQPHSSPYFFCSSFPSSGMVISSGQSSPSDTLDSGTCSDLDGSTPPPLPKKNGVSAAAAAAVAAAAATVTVTVNGSHPQHRRTGSLTSSGAEADSDEDAHSNISCDSLNSHELNGLNGLNNGFNGRGDLDDSNSPQYAFSKMVISNGHHKHNENIMESIQEEKIISPPSPPLKSVALTVRANNLVNNPITAPVAPMLAATAATLTATTNAPVNTPTLINGNTNVVTFNGCDRNSSSVVTTPVITNGTPKPPPPKTPAKPSKSPKTPTSPTAPKTFLPQGLLQDIRDRTATLTGISTPGSPGQRKLRTWGGDSPSPKSTPPKSASPEPKEIQKNQSSLYRILSSEHGVSPSKPSGGIVQERTYEERSRERHSGAQEAAAGPVVGRARAGSYKYEEDRYYQFHLNEREPEPEDAAAAAAARAQEEEEETFAGLKDVMGGKEGSATIRSAKGTVRGVKNRVRAGIATFLHYPDTKNYKEKEAGKVVLYVTTMGIVRHTFQECVKVKKILRTLLVKYEERDAFMSREVQNELRERMHSDQIQVPQLFVEGQHIGDAEAIERLNETGELRKMLKPFKSLDVCNTCQVCGGFRLLPCSICNGSKKSMHRNDFTAEFVALKCMSCDEVGLVKCHAC